LSIRRQGSVDARWWGICKETGYVAAGYDLDEIAREDMPDLDKGRLERNDKGELQGYTLAAALAKEE
jgi:hypothetical protein